MKKFGLIAVVCVMSLSLVGLAADSGSWTGWVSDAHCGAKGTNAKHAECAAKCVNEGAKAVLVVGTDVYTVSNQDSVKAHLGHHIKATGTLDKDAKTVNITKVEMVPEKAM